MAVLDKKSEILDRVPPQNLEAEVGVIAASLMDHEALGLAVEKLTDEYFYKTAHRVIFKALQEIFTSSAPVDLITLTEALQKKGLLDSIGGTAYISSLLDTIPTSAHIEQYIEIVREKYILRSLISTSTEIIHQCYENKEEIDGLLDFAEMRVFNLVQKRIEQSGLIPFKDLIKQSIENIDRLYQNKEGITGIGTGFSRLDEMTSGFQNSDLVVIAARPSMGKTSLALTIAEHIAVKSNLPVAVMSLEMSKEQLVQRLLCSYAHVNLHHVRKGFLSQKEWPTLVNAANKLSEAKIFIDDTPGLSIMELRAKARRLKANHDIKLIIIDYLQLLGGMSSKVESRQQEISEYSRALKALARELNIPVVVLSQLNRSAESRADHKPMLSDLRESGAIEQDADVVILLMRPEYYNPEDSPGEAEIHIAKQRNGPVGTFRLAFLSEYTRFADLSPYEPNAPVPQEMQAQ